MPIRIRLTRKGAKKKPTYRIVVASSESPRDGRFIDIVGTYDPKSDPVMCVVNRDLISDWLAKGAQPSATVAGLLKKQGIL
jgi:small subunit ribosomal protein S16